jgi:hypothetical protein
MKPVKYPNMEAAINALAATIMERYAPEELAQVTATIMLKLTTYYSVELDGSVTIRGSLLDDPECRF